jgi:hypothetical protein
VKLASAFGKDEDEITLRNLPNISDDPQFADIWSRGRRLYRYRNKAVAHRHRDVTSHDFARDTGFTYDDLRALLDDTCACYDRIAQKHQLRTILSVSCEPDFIELVHDATPNASNPR